MKRSISYLANLCNDVRIYIPLVQSRPVNSGLQSHSPIPKHEPPFLQSCGSHPHPWAMFEAARESLKSMASPLTRTFLMQPLKPGSKDGGPLL